MVARLQPSYVNKIGKKVKPSDHHPAFFLLFSPQFHDVEKIVGIIRMKDLAKFGYK
jgi:hypothetical protein